MNKLNKKYKAYMKMYDITLWYCQSRRILRKILRYIQRSSRNFGILIDRIVKKSPLLSAHDYLRICYSNGIEIKKQCNPMIRQKIDKKHTPYVKYKYITQVPCRLNVRVSKAKKINFHEKSNQNHSSLKDKIMEPNFGMRSTWFRQNLDQDLLSILGVKFCFRSLEIVFLVLHLKSSI